MPAKVCNPPTLSLVLRLIDFVYPLNAEYGSLCSTQTDCTRILGDTFVCRNMLCQCPIGQSLKGNQCVSSSAASWSICLWLFMFLSVSKQFI